MKTILMALVLVSSVSAQARIFINDRDTEPRLKNIEEVVIAPNGDVYLRLGPNEDAITILKAAIGYTGLSTKEVVDYIRVFNKDTKKHLTITLRGPSQLNSQLGLTFSK